MVVIIGHMLTYNNGGTGLGYLLEPRGTGTGCHTSVATDDS